MSYQLKGIQLQFAADHMTNARKRNGKAGKWVLVEADSNDNGKTLSMYLKDAYKAKEIRDYSGGYRDFSLVFDSKDRADEVLSDLLNSTIAYKEAHPDLYDYEPDPTPVPESDTGDGEEEEEQKKTDWMPYIVVGAAVVIIIVLLLWKK